MKTGNEVILQVQEKEKVNAAIEEYENQMENSEKNV